MVILNWFECKKAPRKVLTVATNLDDHILRKFMSVLKSKDGVSKIFYSVKDNTIFSVGNTKPLLECIDRRMLDSFTISETEFDRVLEEDRIPALAIMYEIIKENLKSRRELEVFKRKAFFVEEFVEGKKVIKENRDMIHEAVKFGLEAEEKIYLTLLPRVVITENGQDPIEERTSERYSREYHNRYNPKVRDMMNFWVDYLSSKGQIRFPIFRDESLIFTKEPERGR